MAAHPYARAAQEEWRGKVIRLSWKPRAFLFKQFLSDEECDHLVKMARAGAAAFLFFVFVCASLASVCMCVCRGYRIARRTRSRRRPAN